MQARPTAPEAPTGDDAATLTISPEKVCFIILEEGLSMLGYFCAEFEMGHL
jgi:hypothetical protein